MKIIVSTIKWLIALADKKPVLFEIALLLISVVILGYVIMYQEGKVSQCQKEIGELQKRFDARVDSLNNYYINREIRANEEVKQILNSIATKHEEQLIYQQKINQSLVNALNKTNK